MSTLYQNLVIGPVRFVVTPTIIQQVNTKCHQSFFHIKHTQISRPYLKYFKFCWAGAFKMKHLNNTQNVTE